MGWALWVRDGSRGVPFYPRRPPPFSPPHPSSCAQTTHICQPCPENTYYHRKFGMNANCIACPSGRWIADDGVDPSKHDSEDSCGLCQVSGKGLKEGGVRFVPDPTPPRPQAGEYLSDTDTGTCTPCDAGRYQVRTRALGDGRKGPCDARCEATRIFPKTNPSSLSASRIQTRPRPSVSTHVLLGPTWRTRAAMQRFMTGVCAGREAAGCRFSAGRAGQISH